MKRLAYRPEAVASAVAFVEALTTQDAADAFATAVRLREARAVDRDEGEHPTRIVPMSYDREPDGGRMRLESAQEAFADAFGMRLYAERTSDFDLSEPRRGVAPRPGGGWSDGARSPLSEKLEALLVEPHPRSDGAAPMPDAATARWIEAVRAAARKGIGLHLALRCRPSVWGHRSVECRDFAAMASARGISVSLAGAARERLAAIILRAELHADANGVVVVDDEFLVVRTTSAGDDDETAYESPEDADGGDHVAEVRQATLSILAARPRLRNVYLWKLSSAILPRAYDGLIAGVVGPPGFDRAWSEGVVAGMAAGIGGAGVSALLAQVRDPRDASAMASLAVSTASDGVVGLDGAAAFVARSFGARPGGLAPPPRPPAFDPRLVACVGDDGLAPRLLERASALAAGGRILLWGGPGSGKSTFAFALAARIGEPIPVSPAAILAWRWGATERLLAALWARATAGIGGAGPPVLLADEFDAMCGMRESGSGSGNAYLVRCLTDEWLRHLDANPDVPLIATANDLLAIDDAVRRRFAFVIEVRPDLSPDRERLAWSVILGMEPQADWTPIGASVSDFAMAAAHCRLLGEDGAASLSRAVAAAREARLGPRRAAGGTTKRALH